MSEKKSKQLKTRKALLLRLKESGAQTAPALAKDIGVTPMAIRLHLYALADEELITYTEKKASRGRPAKYWALTEKAANIFPDAHQALAVDLLNSIHGTFGEKGLNAVITAHSQNQLKTYKAKLAHAKTTSDRLALLARVRTEEGYMASARREGAEWLFCENHCPICSAAKTCTKLCANELWVFEQLLGTDLKIVREDHILAGARRCQYRITARC